jgi:hypothetical protein
VVWDQKQRRRAASAARESNLDARDRCPFGATVWSRGTLPRIRQLAYERLMHDRRIRLDRENVIAQFSFADFLSGLIVEWHLHDDNSVSC